MRVLDQDGERVVVALTAPPEALNFRGEVHGGTLATLADVSMALAASAGLAEHTVPITAGLSVHYLRPATGPLLATACLLASSERRRIAEVVITNGDGGQVVAATGTFALVRSAGPPPPALPSGKGD